MKIQANSVKRIFLFAGLQLSILMFASTGILTKAAAQYPFLSGKFLLLYSASILIMFVYAILWQLFLKYIPLTTAYANKSVSTVWTMLFCYAFFKEEISISMVIGAVLIIIGVFVVVTADE